jgi:hypothetical protein
MNKKELIIGNTYKITGGKYKKFKECTLQKINKTYSDCELPFKDFEADDKCLNQVVKIKNIYLLAAQLNIINMPETDDLQIVENLDTYLIENPEKKEEFKKLAVEPNITAEIFEDPPIKENTLETLEIENTQLKNDNIHLFNELTITKEELVNIINNGKTNREKELETIIIKLVESLYSED